MRTKSLNRMPSFKVLRVLYLVAYTGAIALFEYGFTGAIIYLKRIDTSEFVVSYNLIVVYVIVGSIFNAYIISFAVITLLTWCEQVNPKLGGKFVSFKRVLQTVVMLFHRVMGFNSDSGQLDLAEEVIEH